MSSRDPRVDEYIAKSADFAMPILRYLRETVHVACPDVQETIKWSTPTFDYHGIMCGMSAFKQHCAFGFWKAKLVFGDELGETTARLDRITAVDDLPSKKALIGFIRKAMELNESGTSVPKEPKPKRKALPVPDEFRRALGKNKPAQKAFDSFSPSHQREYIEWITEAKTDETRGRRVKAAVEWIAEGKPRNWKYMKR